MRLRGASLVCLLCLGCHSVLHPGGSVQPSSSEVSPPAIRFTGAIPATREGEAGKQESPQAGSDSPQPSPDPRGAGPSADAIKVKANAENRDLTLAAVYLDQGKRELACHHLGLFVERNPHHHNARLYFAELLSRLERDDEAREQFEQVVASLQEEYFLDVRHIVHCHGRLADLAEKMNDEFDRQLHRGIALYWLAQVPSTSQEEEDQMPVEALLCKSAAALTQAHQMEPGQARPCWYLHNVWHKLGQNQPAQRYLNIAQARASFSPLTPSEHRGMLLVQK